MKLIEVNSSAIKSVGYNAKTHTLLIEFVHSGLYSYHNVPSDKYQQIINAESVGSYYNQYIRHAYKAKKHV